MAVDPPSPDEERRRRATEAELGRRVTFPEDQVFREDFSVLANLEAPLLRKLRLSVPPRGDYARLYAFWTGMMGQAGFVRPRLVPTGRPARSFAVASNSAAIAAGASRWATSRNWSGAVIVARDAMLFRRVQGAWRVPAPTSPTGNAPGNAIPGAAWRSSAWIGLDGYRGWSKSLPQIGTASAVDANGPRCYAWVQWWVRDGDFGEVEIENFAVKPGDRIRAEIVVHDAEGGVLTFTLRNLDGPPGANAVSIDWAPEEVEIIIGNQKQPQQAEGKRTVPVEGRTAVWCLERPSVEPEKLSETERQKAKRQRRYPLYRLPRIDPVTFTEALAEMRDPRNPAAAGVERDLTAARQLRMVGTAQGPHGQRVARLTTPEAPASPGRLGRLGVKQVERDDA